MCETTIFDSPDLSDDDLVLAAEDLFLALDREEAELHSEREHISYKRLD